MSPSRDWAPDVRQEAKAFLRAISGAFLFGTPLLYTMEMWWIGTYAETWKLLVFLVGAFVVNAHLNYFAGFKETTAFGATIGDAIAETIDALAVGIVAAVIVLLTLNQIQPGDPLDSILGKVLLQAVPLSIGASVANAVFSSGATEQEQAQDQTDPWRQTANDVGATVAGALFIGFGIAPTEEVPMLATRMDVWHQLALIALSLVIGHTIVFVSGFDRTSQQRSRGPFQHPVTETALSYAVSLLVSLIVLYLFDRVGADAPWSSTLAQVLVLGLPAMVGGAAGRVIL